MVRLFIFWTMQKFVCDFFKSLETQIGTPDHQQRRDRPRRKGTDGECGWHQDCLVHERSLRHRPHYRQFAIRFHAGDLLRIEREIVAQHAGRFLRRHFRHQRDIVENGGDIVEKGQETGGHE